MKKYNIYIFALLMMLGVSSCQKESDTIDFTNDPNAIKVDAKVGGNLFTRSNPTDDTKQTIFNSGDQIAISNTGELGAFVNYTFSGTAWNATNPSEYLSWGNDKMTFSAYYPVNATTSMTSFTLPADQSDLAKIALADYMRVTTEITKSGINPINLKLERQTARIIVKIGSFGDQYEDSEKAVSNVKILSGGTTVTPYNQGGNTVNAIFTALVQPSDIVAGNELITLTDGQSKPLTVKAPSTMTAGNSYTYTLHVGKDAVSITSITVTDWNTGETISSDTEKEPNYIEINGIKVARGNLIYDGNGGCRIGQPNDGGLFFQFGSLIGWSGSGSNDGTGRGTNNALSVVVKPVSCNKPDNICISNDGSNIGALSDFYFNYSLPPYETDGTDIRSFDVDIAGAEATGTLGSGRYAALGVGDPCSYYLGGKWRLPTREEWQTIMGASIKVEWSNTNGWSPKGDFDSITSYAKHTSGLKIPASGLHFIDNGHISYIDQPGSYWSSSVKDATLGCIMYFYGNSVSLHGETFRSYISPVRCVHE